MRYVSTLMFNTICCADMKGARITLAIGAICWSIMLLWPGDLFPTAAQIAAGTGRTTYTLMAIIMPELLWAAAFGIHGIFLFISTFVRVPPAAAMLDAFNGAALWSTATAACFLSHFKGWATYQPPAAMGADLALALTSWWWFVRVWADKKYEADH